VEEAIFSARHLSSQRGATAVWCLWWWERPRKAGKPLRVPPYRNRGLLYRPCPTEKRLLRRPGACPGGANHWPF